MTKDSYDEFIKSTITQMKSSLNANNELMDAIYAGMKRMTDKMEASAEHFFELGFNKVYFKDEGKDIIVTPFEPERPYSVRELTDRKAFDEACDGGDDFLKELRIKQRKELREKLKNEYNHYNFSFDGLDNNSNGDR